ncbi:hypothetical protein [Algoriphagus boritolerans]|uniref:hypothetical protein n=1 Tax=Algoriphagus boritolerans TaxID=308111 RepID=UPI000B133C7C
MKFFIIALIATLTFQSLPSREVNDEWESLLDTELTNWENYLSFRHKLGYNGKVPKDSKGVEIAPIGYNKDEFGVFTMLDEPAGPVLRVSGEIYGSIFTKKILQKLSLKVASEMGDNQI